MPQTSRSTQSASNDPTIMQELAERFLQDWTDEKDQQPDRNGASHQHVDDKLRPI
ncbi:MAG: hypothetical protein WA001_04740 [Patescibacteria group bacterium]